MQHIQIDQNPPEMNDRIFRFMEWIQNINYSPEQKPKLRKAFLIMVFALLFSVGTNSGLFAQSEDTTETQREAPRVNPEQTQEPVRTPYNSDILQSDIERYELKDYGSNNRFYRQLKYLTAEDFLMREEEGYQRYGEKWERKINEDLMKILRATFKEESELVRILRILKPFLGFGIWEPYEVPITRVEYENKVPVEEN